MTDAPDEDLQPGDAAAEREEDPAVRSIDPDAPARSMFDDDADAVEPNEPA